MEIQGWEDDGILPTLYRDKKSQNPEIRNNLEKFHPCFRQENVRQTSISLLFGNVCFLGSTERLSVQFKTRLKADNSRFKM